MSYKDYYEYRGHTVDRIFPSGYLTVFFADYGFYRADSIEGIRSFVDQYENGELA